jgi:hypothetical protein
VRPAARERILSPVSTSAVEQRRRRGVGPTTGQAGRAGRDLAVSRARELGRDPLEGHGSIVFEGERARGRAPAARRHRGMCGEAPRQERTAGFHLSVEPEPDTSGQAVNHDATDRAVGGAVMNRRLPAQGVSRVRCAPMSPQCSLMKLSNE